MNPELTPMLATAGLGERFSSDVVLQERTSRVALHVSEVTQALHQR